MSGTTRTPVPTRIPLDRLDELCPIDHLKAEADAILRAESRRAWLVGFEFGRKVERERAQHS